MARNPQAFAAYGRNPQAFAADARSAQAHPAMAHDAQAFQALAGDAQAMSALASNAQAFQALAANAQAFQALASNAQAFQAASNAQAFQAMGANAQAFQALARMVQKGLEAGQAAIEMEALAAPHMADAADGYPIAIEAGRLIRLTWRPFWEGILTDAGRGEHPGLMAARVHQGLISALSRLAIRFCRERSPTRAVLSGGVFQNRLLLEGISQALRGAGVDVLLPEGVPANDGGIALGQAAIAAAISHPPL